MKKIFSFSLLLILGLVASQILPGMLGESYPAFRAGATTFLYVCLSFIMINVGREFEIDKKRWRSYAEDYFIAMATAAVPWLLIALYYVFVLLPPEFWGNGDAWKENLLLSRFAAPTSAGILFTMLAALRLKRSWMYRKIQVLAIFDDLDTILLMIPLQILMIGLRWQLFVVVVIVFLLLWLGWKKLSTYELRQDWWAILTYSVVVFGVTQLGLPAFQILFRRGGQYSYRGAASRFRIGYGDENQACRISRGADGRFRHFVLVHVFGWIEHAVVYRYDCCDWGSCFFRDRFAAHDVVGRDRIPCGDRLVAVQPGQTFPDVFLS